MKKYWSNIVVQMILVISGVFLLGGFLPLSLKAGILSISLLMKELLLFVLPLIIFILVFSSFSCVSSGLIAFTSLLLILICFSNFCATMFSYQFGFLTQNFILNNSIIETNNSPLHANFTISLPKICSNALALSLGMIAGIVTSIRNIIFLKKTAKLGLNIVNKFLARIFTPTIPIFILGFILKMQHEGTLEILFKNFLPLVSVILTIYLIYLGLFYLLLNKGNIHNTITCIKNILPAGITGFSSMSSAVAMPPLISGTTENAIDKNIPRKIVPFITNTHMLGDALGIPLMAFSLYILEYNTFPPLYIFFIFSIGYVFAKFASAGIPGGTILIMIPVLESKLGFTSAMSSTILMIYLLLDPICTFGNILGNGCFTILFEKILHIKKERPSSEITYV
ncbi:MAG: cation:dicarboxylase symporter family transporter [Legionellales bacterium]|nr:cation:dicarboxylase symporter family transporter [Legionellales bacterium]